MSHRFHPDPGRNDPPDARLFDDCDRCDEQAQLLVGLDRENLAWWWAAMDGIKREGRSLGRQMTKNEYRIINEMYVMAIIFERLSHVWPTPSVLVRIVDIEVPA